MKKRVVNLVAILILVSVIGSFFVFCSPSVGDACDNYVKIYREGVEDWTDADTKEYKESCEKNLKGKDKKHVECFANAKTKADIEKCIEDMGEGGK